MKTAASLTIGLKSKDALWGMLVCHHQTPCVAGPEVRALADTIGQLASLMLGSLSKLRSRLSGWRATRSCALWSIGWPSPRRCPRR